MVFGWENPLGWWAFLSLIPLIIIYLIKPRAKELDIPSLMFFLKSKSPQKQRSFFQKLIRDLLFLLQLLTLLLLSFYFIEPYTTIETGLFIDNVVLVVDISASTKVSDNEVFKDVLKESKNSLGKTNTIILASNAPIVGIKEASKRDALRYLKSLRPSDGRTNLGDSLLEAEKYIKGNEDKVVVISDFISTDGTEFDIAKNSLSNKGINVDFIPIKKGRKENIGIVDLDISAKSSTVYVRNYNERDEVVNIKINNEQKALPIAGNSIETHSFTPEKGVNKIELDVDDDFTIDNEAFVLVPEEREINVLVISDNPSSFLEAALTSSGKVNIDVSSSSSFYDRDYDVYVVSNIREGLNKKVVGFLDEKVKDGAGLIIHAQIESPELDYGGFLKLDIEGVKGKSIVNIEKITKFTKDLAFGSIDNYFATKDEEGMVVAKAEEGAIISVSDHGNGQIIYYGILEDKSDFKLSPSYPLFWTNILKYLSNVDTIDDVNAETGSILALASEKEIKTPFGKVKTDILIFDEVGIYEFEDRVYVANLVNEIESNINKEGVESVISKEGKESEEDIKYGIEKTLIMIICILLFLELLFVKFRGDV